MFCVAPFEGAHCVFVCVFVTPKHRTPNTRDRRLDLRVKFARRRRSARRLLFDEFAFALDWLISVHIAQALTSFENQLGREVERWGGAHKFH